MFRILPAGSQPRFRSYRLEWWHIPVYMLVIVHILLYMFAHARKGPLSVVCWYFGSDRILWGGFVVFWLMIGLIVSNFRRPFWTRWRGAAYIGMFLLVVFPLFYRAFPSRYADRPSEIAFRLPLDGPITVGWGGTTPSQNYHVAAPAQAFAYDLLMQRDGSSHRGDGSKLTDYYIYDLPVLAPCDGKVVATHDGDPDMPIGQLGGGSSPAGNHVILEVARNQHLFLCHLRPGSLRVKPGDTVRQGQEIGRVGNSGNTSEPHLHIHLQDTDNLIAGEGIPLYFHNYTHEGKLVSRGLPTGGVSNGRFSGQVVEHAGP